MARPSILELKLFQPLYLFNFQTAKLLAPAMVRADGRKIHPMYLVEVKTPTESKGPWDYYKVPRHHSGR